MEKDGNTIKFNKNPTNSIAIQIDVGLEKDYNQVIFNKALDTIQQRGDRDMAYEVNKSIHIQNDTPTIKPIARKTIPKKPAVPAKEEIASVPVKGEKDTAVLPIMHTQHPIPYNLQISNPDYQLTWGPNHDDVFILALPDRITGKLEVACTLKRWGEMEVPTKWRDRFDELALRFLAALAHFGSTLPLPVSPKQETIIKFCQEHKMNLADFDAEYFVLPTKGNEWKIGKISSFKMTACTICGAPLVQDGGITWTCPICHAMGVWVDGETR